MQDAARKPRSNHRFAVVLPLLAGACWGVTGIFIRILDAIGMDNPTIVFSRTSMGALLAFLYILCTDRSKLRVKPSDLPLIASVGIFGSALLLATYNIAITELSLSLAAILLCLAPVFVLLISSILFHERITRKKLFCMVLALSGCVMLSGVFEAGHVSWSMLGILMGLASAVCNGIFILVSKAVSDKGYSIFTVCMYSATCGSILILPFTDLPMLGHYIAASPASSLSFLAVQAIVSSIGPTMIYIVALKYLDAGKTAILQSGAEPTSAFLAGLICYQEFPAPAGLIGMVITIIALMVLAGDSNA